MVLSESVPVEASQQGGSVALRCDVAQLAA